MTAGREAERGYLLGTHDEERARLALQHRVWRARALDAWRRAGFGAGRTLVDLGCGPGWATLDLAELVAPRGSVHAIDRSRRFLRALEAEAARRGLHGIVTHEIDLDAGALPALSADGAWARWIFAFVKRPRDLVARVRDVLRPGGTIVLHEYFDYRTWRTAPRTPALEAFVEIVVDSWRADGGEPDVALDLPAWLEEAGFEIRSTRPWIEIAPPGDPFWAWPMAFVEVALERLAGLGRIDPRRAREIGAEIEAASAKSAIRMITPAVLEIVAVRR